MKVSVGKVLRRLFFISATSRIRPAPFKRNFIRFRSVQPERPLQYLSMDIKYVHVHGTGRNALLLTVIDIYSRKVLIHIMRSNKKGRCSGDVVADAAGI
jgi:hypothetical protein